MTTTWQSTTTPQQPDPRRRRRRAALIAGTGVLLVGGATAGAIALGTGVAGALRSETTAQSLPGVHEIVVDLDEGSVRLTAAPGAAVDVRTTRAWTPGYEPVLDQGVIDGVLTLRSDCPEFNVGCEVTREIGVPAGTAVRVRSTAGPVEAFDLDVPRFAAETVAGPVTASFVSAPEAVRAQTVTGPVDLRVPQGSYRVDAGTTVGQVRVGVIDDPRAPRSIEAHTVTGPVTVAAR